MKIEASCLAIGGILNSVVTMWYIIDPSGMRVDVLNLL